jgi:superfamily II DNA or RNA helicase
MQPDARVLVMAPNRDICLHWEREYRKFVKKHYRVSDDIVRGISNNEPLHPPQLLWRLEELATEVEKKNSHFFITTIYSLSGLVRGEDDEGFDKLKGAADTASSIHNRIKQALGEQGFDLVIVDEAHYFRNSEGKSQRAKAAREFFGRSGDRLGARTLLMTATPSHKSMEDISAILGYVTDVGEARADVLLKKFALRRLRRMKGLNGTYDKYSYRNELAKKADFDDDPTAEMFFALYQKRLVQQEFKDGRRFLYGYLEGFESFDVQPHEAEQRTEEDVAKRDFQEAPDRKILVELAKNIRGLPAHPKYDVLVKICTPDDVFDAAIDVHEHKHLIFVRRIPSVREIAKRINNGYDRQMGQKIAKALAPNDSGALFRKWESSYWSREAFNRLFGSQAQADDTVLLDDNGAVPEEHTDTDVDVHSRVANLFVVKKTGANRSTDCSNFSLRLRKSESLFSLLLEPASDYRDGAYIYYYRRYSGTRLRDEYASAALETRECGEKRGAGVTADKETHFKKPMQTLWGLMYRLLEPASRERIERLAHDTAQAENFGRYLKNGFLFASPVIVELYCWYAEFCRCSETGDAEQRYRAFLKFISKKLNKSLALAYFRAALETFEALCENWEGNWQVLTGLSSPAFYASGAVKDRQRLILGFNSPFYPNVLAATSVLQEGVNLHLQCRKVHHYGIAWTPGDNEQRVGRVDRLFGKVNAQLERDGRAELAIHYPYLARSFDEEQLASFIREKHIIEERMDACRQSRTSAEIDLRNATEDWTSYLRKPTYCQSALTIMDPFPYDPKEAKIKIG